MTQDIDLSNMTAGELDKLIFEAAQKRAGMEPPVPREHPKSTEAVLNPAWYTEAIEIGGLFQIRHPGFGWLTFILPHAERAHLLSVWLHQSLTFNSKPAGAIKPVSNKKEDLH